MLPPAISGDRGHHAQSFTPAAAMIFDVGDVPSPVKNIF